MRQRPTLAFVTVNTVFLAAATAVASVQWWPIYQDPRLITLVAGALLVGSAIAIAGARWRWPSAVVMLATLVAFAVVGVPLAVPGRAIAGVLPSVDGLGQLGAATALGWKQLLTVTLPVGSYQVLLVPLLVLLLTTTVAGLSLALRAKAGELAVLAPVTVLVVGIVFGPDSARWPRVVSLALLGILLAWLVWRRWYRRRAAIGALAQATTGAGDAPGAAASSVHRTFDARTFLAGVTILVIAVSVATLATSVIPPAGARKVLRTAIEQPFDPREYASPLASFRRYLEPATAEDTLFSVTGLADGSFVRIATLDTYDGIVYSVGSEIVHSASGSFTRVPYRFDQSSVDGSRVRLEVTIGDYNGVWVPTVGKLESVRFTGARAATLADGFYYNDISGTAAQIEGLHSGDSYSLEAVLPAQPSPSRLTGLRPGSAVVPQLGTLPPELAVVLDSYTADATSPGSRLVAMIDGLRANGYISHGLAGEEPSRSGHSADRLSTLLAGSRMIGDAEQYAVTAALMARQLGFPARVVFGFAPTEASAGETRVTGESVSARIEVDTEQWGWVLIDPVPPPRDIPEEEPEDPQVVSRPPSIVQPPIDNPPVVDDQAPPQSTQDEITPDSSLLGLVLLLVRVAGFTLIGLAVLVSPLFVVIAVKARRRRRRRNRGSPLERVRSGWHEYRDSVIDHRFVPPVSATRAEFAQTAGGARAQVLAAVADRAVFSPDETRASEADRVWSAVDELRLSLDTGLTRRARLAARVSLRSLRADSDARVSPDA